MPQTTEHQAAPGGGLVHAHPFAGVLIATVELERWPSTYDPADTCFLFRSPEVWTTLTLRRTEKWEDDVDRAVAGSLRVIIEEHPTATDLARVMQDVYGFTGWRAMLDAASAVDPDLRRVWVPVQVERDLNRASFYRPDLVQRVEAGDPATLRQLCADIELELASVGFEVRAMDAQVRRDRIGGNPVLAHAVLRRYGHVFDAVVRMDCAGEIYTRLTDDSGRRVCEVGADDDA
ncbi:MAG: hypothetical protein ACRDZV_00010 [Acidimicrobiia bacterium]